MPRTMEELVGHVFVGWRGDSFWLAYLRRLRENDLEGAVAVHKRDGNRHLGGRAGRR